MIVAEERLNEVFSQIPGITGNKPVYAWGDQIHLNKWIKKNPDTYPLIYQISKEEDHDILQNRLTTKWEAVIATRNKNTDLLNDERWAMSFRNELNPIASKIAEGFIKCNFINWNHEVKIKRFGNYGENNEHFTVDIWDAILFEATIEITDNCSKPISWD